MVVVDMVAVDTAVDVVEVAAEDMEAAGVRRRKPELVCAFWLYDAFIL